jgi:hypothetical protein
VCTRIAGRAGTGQVGRGVENAGELFVLPLMQRSFAGVAVARPLAPAEGWFEGVTVVASQPDDFEFHRATPVSKPAASFRCLQSRPVYRWSQGSGGFSGYRSDSLRPRWFRGSSPAWAPAGRAA